MRAREWSRPSLLGLPGVAIAGAWIALAARNLNVTTHHANQFAPDGETSTQFLGYWALMTVAMMGPATMPKVRYVAIRTLAWRRGRAMAEFAVGYLAVWIGVGLAVEKFFARIDLPPGWPSVAATLAIATLWQLLPTKSVWLRACHSVRPIPPTTVRADIAAAGLGARTGLACVGSCWALMLVMLAAPLHHLLWMIALTWIVTYERSADRPRAAARTNAFVLAGTTIAVLAIRPW